jgi:DNA-binding MarR family transcriptional regulator
MCNVASMPVIKTEPRWLTDSEQTAWRAYLAGSRLLAHHLEREFQKHGLSASDYEILVHLSETPEQRLRMSELARATLLEKSRLSHQITRLERDGLVARESCPGDRRGQFAVLTPTGLATIERVAPLHVAEVRRRLFDLLTPEQVAAVTAIFTPVADQLLHSPACAEAERELAEEQ